LFKAQRPEEGLAAFVSGFRGRRNVHDKDEGGRMKDEG
jgi:hypothetical protein